MRCRHGQGKAELGPSAGSGTNPPHHDQTRFGAGARTPGPDQRRRSTTQASVVLWIRRSVVPASSPTGILALTMRSTLRVPRASIPGASTNFLPGSRELTRTG